MRREFGEPSDRLIGRFFTPGHVRTKGSMKPQLSRGKSGRLTVHLVESGEYAVPWKRRMIKAILEQCRRSEPYGEAVEVRAVFVYEMPPGGMSLSLPYPTLKDGVYAQGDLDKLLRNLLDALTQSNLIKDDSLVCRIISDKRWSTGADDPAGVKCKVRPM